MDVQDIKKNANNAFAQRDFGSAFHTLWELGPVDFLKFSQKEKGKHGNWFKKPKPTTYFCETFVLHQRIFDGLMCSEVADQFLRLYFACSTKFQVNSSKFVEKLALEHPSIFVKAIQVNQVFLDKDFWIQFQNIKNLSEEVLTHKEVWEYLYKTELQLWGQIEERLEPLQNLSFAQILANCILALEEIRLNQST